MNVEDSIQAHARWKIRLVSYLKNPDGSIKAGELGADDRCDLGKWIHGEGRHYAGDPEMAALRAAHANFHRAAADVVRKIDAGTVTDAGSLMSLHSPFSTASLAVVNHLKALAQKIA